MLRHASISLLIITLCLCMCMAEVSHTRCQEAKPLTIKELQHIFNNATTLDLADFLSRHGLSAGIVTQAPEQVVGRSFGSRNTLDAWADQRAVDVDDLARPLPAPLSAKAALERFAVRAPERLTVVQDDRFPPVLQDHRAPGCDHLLARPVARPLMSKTLIKGVVQLINSVSMAQMSDSWVGTCGGIGDDPMAEDVIVPEGRTLRQGLGEFSLRFSGVIWVAVETPDGGCSIGVIQPRTKVEGTCFTRVAEDVR